MYINETNKNSYFIGIGSYKPYLLNKIINKGTSNNNKISVMQQHKNFKPLGSDFLPHVIIFFIISIVFLH